MGKEFGELPTLSVKTLKLIKINKRTITHLQELSASFDLEYSELVSIRAGKIGNLYALSEISKKLMRRKSRVAKELSREINAIVADSGLKEAPRGSAAPVVEKKGIARSIQSAKAKGERRQDSAPGSAIRKLFGYSYEVSRISDGDALPVGGSLVSDKEKLQLICNFGDLDGLFKKMEGRSNALEGELDKIEEWLKKANIQIDPRLFAILEAFNGIFYKEFKQNPEYALMRAKAYASKGNVKLSDAFGGGFAECAEIAAIAQYYLQKAGLQTKYFSGAVLRSEKWEHAEPHSFIVIKWEGKTYIFDPANPVAANVGSFPSILSTSPEFDAEVSKNVKRFVTSEDLISKKRAFFGVDNHTNVVPEKHIV